MPVDQLRVNNPTVLPIDRPWRFQISRGATVDGKYVPHESFVTASSSEEAHLPGNALDDNNQTRWCASGPDLPQWWQVDMQETTQVTGLELAWEIADGQYQFTAESSLNGSDWTTLADRSAAPGVGDGVVKVTPVKARFVRININGTGGTANTQRWASLREVKIKISQNGKEAEWHPKPDAAASALATVNDFSRADLDDSSWHSMPARANWEVEGYSIPTYNNPDDAVGLYRQWVDVPANFAGQQVLWHFDGVWDSAEIFVNGQRVGYHESGFTAFDIDITGALKPGQKNLLAVRVCKQTTSVDLDTGDFWSLGGIYRENYLVALPQLHVADITVVTDLDAKYQDATLHAAVAIQGPQGTGFKLSGQLCSLDGKPVQTLQSASGTIGADKNTTVSFEAPVAAPRLWSAEKPNLYYLVLTLQNGDAAVETVQERFGFRKIEVKKNILLWNGVPIKCTGTCRHEEWSAIGHALTEHEWQTDIALMKAANINAVRTSHYNHAQRFLELCEEKGLYVLDEVPGCWDNLSDLSLEPYFIQHVRETLNRDKNRPCVLAWSLGNESGSGPNGEAMLSYALAHDPTRPAFVSCNDKASTPRQTFNDYHYPGDNDLNNIAAGQQAPAVCTEEPHIFFVTGGQKYDYGVNDLWGQVLQAVWKHVWPSQTIFGSFVWEWQDQGLADKFASRNDVDKAGLRNDNHKGIVDGYRNPKPEYFNVKMVYSPVWIGVREADVVDGTISIPLQNRYAFTDLSELTCRWQALSAEKPIANGELHLACPPQSSTVTDLPATAGMDTLRFEFIHPDGRSVYTTRIHISGTPVAAAPAPLPNQGPIKITEDDNAVVADFAGTQLTISRQTGLIQGWKVADDVVLAGGPIMNLGEGRDNHDHDFGAGEHIPFVYGPNPPVLKNVSVTFHPSPHVAQISVTGDLVLNDSADPCGHLVLTYDLHQYAQLDVSWRLTWATRESTAWEIGLKWPLPPQFNRLSWLRDGLWTEYPPDHIGANDGSVSSDNISFRCTKRDTIWATLSGPSPYELGLLSDGVSPLHSRAIATDEATMLFATAQAAAPYDFSSGFLNKLEIQLRPGESTSGAFKLRIAARKDVKQEP